MFCRRSATPPILHKCIIMKTLQNKQSEINTLREMYRPGPDLSRPKSRLNMPFLKIIRLLGGGIPPTERSLLTGAAATSRIFALNTSHALSACLTCRVPHPSLLSSEGWDVRRSNRRAGQPIFDYSTLNICGCPVLAC